MRLARRSKYNAVSVVEDGYTFASLKERRRYQELKLLGLAGEIHELKVHPPFTLYAYCFGELKDAAAMIKIGIYTPDFSYTTKAGEDIVEDCKGGQATKTEAYRLRKKILKANYGISVVEV